VLALSKGKKGKGEEHITMVPEGVMDAGGEDVMIVIVKALEFTVTCEQGSFVVSVQVITSPVTRALLE
jgi:hypothetical protein